MVQTAHANGHFYSPVVDPAELLPRVAELWPDQPPECPGLDFNESGTRTVLEEWFPRWLGEFDYPEHADPTAAERYYIQNSQFSWLDCRALYVMLRQLRPARMIEVGCGFSSLLSADVNRRHFDLGMHFTCIEPYPRPFLLAGVPGITALDVRKVQDIPAAWFAAELQAGDILFIDSSHVCKTGSDVNHLYLQVLPRLRAGVIVHIHDIFLPCEYQQQWVLTENRSWNEQYLVQVMLQHSRRWRVLFGCNYAFQRFPQGVAQALGVAPGRAYGGGSLWLEVVDAPCAA